MKVIRTESYDSFDAYRIIDAPALEPGEGEARIRVRAIGVGYVEALTALGGYQVKAPLPYTPGGDIAGIIDSVGPGVGDVKPGDRVMGYAHQGFAEYTITRADGLGRLPNNVSFASGASFSTNFGTAMHALWDRAQVKAGERLLVIGAAGGTGVAAIQVGREMGADVIAVASTPEKRAFALEQGARIALDTNVEGWRDRLKEATGGKGVDVIFDPVCGQLFEPAFRSLAWNGRHLVIGFTGGEIPALKANLPLLKGAALLGVDIRQASIFEPEKLRASRLRLQQWLEQGKVTAPHGKVFPFDEFKQALAHAYSGKGAGKTILEIAP